jgi:hypothetical protein
MLAVTLYQVMTSTYPLGTLCSVASLLVKQCLAGMIFVSYLTDFSYFPLIIVFPKLLDMVRTGQK